MEHVLVLILAAITSVGIYRLAVGPFGLAPGGFLPALLEMFELVGLSILFFIVNLLTGIIIVLAVRTLTASFVSAYVLNDASLLLLSGLQGSIFASWRARDCS